MTAVPEVQPEEIVVDAASEIGSTIARRPAALPVHDEPVGPGSILQLLDKAMERGVPVEALEKLQAMLERVSDRAAAREYADALARFQEICPPISRNRNPSFATQGGGTMSWEYADLNHIAHIIRKPLKACGLSYGWNCKMDKEQPGYMIVRCTLRHINGHSEFADFPVPVESNLKISQQQKNGWALTYGQRRSLIQVTGITTADDDNDGADLTPISEDQAADLRSLIEEVAAPAKRAMVEKNLLKHVKVERIEDIPAAMFEEVVKGLREYAENKAKAEAAAKEKGK